MPKNIRYFWRFLVIFFHRHTKVVFLGFLLGVFSFFILPKFFSLLLQIQGTETRGVVGRWEFQAVPSQIQKLAGRGLTKLNQDGTVSPDLAKGWEAKENGKVYTFFLKEGLTWHDGSKIKAEDINYNFSDVEISIENQQTIKFTLKEPYTPFPVILTRPVFKKGLTSAGEYKVQDIARSGRFIESISLKSLVAKKSNLKYRFYPTESAAKTAFKLGEVNVLEEMVDPGGLEGWRNTKITPEVRQDRYIAIFFDTNKPFLEDKTLRQALAYAIKKDPEQGRAYGPISPTSWAYNDDLKPYDFDLDKAKKLYQDSMGEKEEKITLKLSTVPSLLVDAGKIKNSWEGLGIEVEIEVMPSPEADFEALLAIQEIPNDPDQYSLWHSTQERSNITHFQNPRVDKLLEDGRKTIDTKERRKIYLDFQRFLVEETPAIFLYHPTLYRITRD